MKYSQSQYVTVEHYVHEVGELTCTRGQSFCGHPMGTITPRSKPGNKTDPNIFFQLNILKKELLRVGFPTRDILYSIRIQLAPVSCT